MPFAADVVIRFDSDTSPLIDLSSNDPSRKWTGGTVYKYDGSAWNSSDIDGFDINYGAMAVVGDGNDSLITEIAVAKTAAGIGEDPGALKFMLYLVEEGSGGDILAAFPVSNSGTEFSDLYALDSLGTGQLPRRSIRLNDGDPVSVSPDIPLCTRLKRNYPNPFNPVTRIGYSISRDSGIQILLYDLKGRKIATLIDKYHRAGSYEIPFNASSLAAGVYFYRLIQNGHIIQTRKMLLLK
ncbi:MAG: T9SS type A sorting domain-containing protein [Candidatus Marinimicrobia bacterium]|nr:T9SS type A sorting domain-containing protein [Candidatus Neomarinimicrobiota bacterium]